MSSGLTQTISIRSLMKAKTGVTALGTKRLRTMGGKTRARSEKAHAAIFEAALNLLDEFGYRQVSIDAIAERSGSAKTTIYRWWPSKAALILDAYIHTRERQIAVPDTGHLQDDLELFVRRTCKALRGTSAGPAMAACMAEAQGDAAIAKLFREQWIAGRRNALRSLFVRAIGRGQLVEKIDLELAIDGIYGPIWYRLLNAHAPLNDTFACGLVRQLMIGIESRARTK